MSSQIVISTGDGSNWLDYNRTNASTWTFAVPIVNKTYTVSTLPVGHVGMQCYATNARAWTSAGAIQGSGAGTGSLVTHNGTLWQLDGTNITAVA